jgi:ABC-type multidrug transport system fused ATPase/permease subunit
LKNTLYTIFSLLSPQDKSKYLLISFLLTLLTFFEILSIASLGPFLQLALNPNFYLEKNYLNKIYNFFNFSKVNDLIIFLGFFLIASFIISSLLSILTNWKLISYIHNLGNRLSDRLYLHYLFQNRSFHLINDKSTLVKKINDVQTVVSNIFLPLLILISKLIIIFFIIIFLFFINPIITLNLLLFLVTFYYVFFQYIKKKIKKSSEEVNVSSLHKLKTLHESFSGIREIILSNLEHIFFNKFSKYNKIFHDRISKTIILSQIPKPILELISVILIVIFFMIMLIGFNKDLLSVIPIISIYALAGLRIVPSVQLIFQNITIIKGSISSFDSIKADIEKANDNLIVPCQEDNYRFTFNDKIIFEKVYYSYPLSKKKSVNNLNLEIKKKQFVAIIGPNGSGKSTIINLLSGILYSEKGSILVDGKILNEKTANSWRQNIGIVSQDFFLFDDTIFNNLTLGLKNVELQNIEKVIDDCKLSDLVKQLPLGLDTIIGNNGLFLSGGQRQKIAIARCLLKNPEIIIFDEATSALDLSSENIINEMINTLKGKKTIIVISHKNNSIKFSDLIYCIKNGEVADSGSYESLLNKNYFVNLK